MQIMWKYKNCFHKYTTWIEMRVVKANDKSFLSDFTIRENMPYY